MANVCPVCNNPVGPEDSACPHCGFKLLGSTQRFAPVALPDESFSPPRRPNPRPCFTWYAGLKPACRSS